MKYFIGAGHNKIAYSIVFLIAISITSIPVISKIFFDMGIINTGFANIVLTASTLQDLCLWILLNSSINLVDSKEIDYLNAKKQIYLYLLMKHTVHILSSLTDCRNQQQFQAQI